MHTSKTTLGFPQWSGSDKPETKDYNAAFALLNNLIQEQNIKIAALEAQIQGQQ